MTKVLKVLAISAFLILASVPATTQTGGGSSLLEQVAVDDCGFAGQVCVL